MTVTYGVAQDKKERDAFEGLSYTKRISEEFSPANLSISTSIHGILPKSWINESKKMPLRKPAGELCYLDLHSEK